MGWRDAPEAEAATYQGAPEAQAAQPEPQIGALDTISSKIANAFPMGKQLASGGAAAILQAYRALGGGKSGVKLGPEALQAGMTQDTSSAIPGFADAYRESRQRINQASDLGGQQNPWLGALGTGIGLAGSLALPVARVGSGIGGALASGMLTGGGYGALAGLNDADLTNAKDAASKGLRGAAVGLAAGVPAGALSYGLGRLGQAAGNKVVDLDQAVANKAAQKAADETASARSLAGRTAQDAYRQLEHLRDLGAMRRLTPDEAQAAAQLEQELAGKAQGKLLPSIAAKEQAAQEFAQTASTEGQRANQMAADKLSGAELRRQVGARLLRYGLPAAGGAIGHYLGGGFGAGTGALVGAGLRPMMHSLIRMAGQPVVQRPVMDVTARLLGAVGPHAATPIATKAEQELGELVPSLLMADDSDANTKKKGTLAALSQYGQ